MTGEEAKKELKRLQEWMAVTHPEEEIHDGETVVDACIRALSHTSSAKKKDDE